MVWQEELLRGAAEKFNAGDAEGLARIFHDDMVFHAEPQIAEQPVYRGRDGVRAWMREAATRWSSVRMGVADIQVAGDRALAEVDLVGAGQTGGGGAWRLYVVVAFTDGLVSRGHVLLDRQEALERLARPDGVD